MTDISAILQINFAVTVAAFIVLWVLSLRGKDPSFVDAWWALGMVLTAWISFVMGGKGAHSLAATLLVTAWGLRLGCYLLARWRQHGKDRRYAALMERVQTKRKWSYATASLVFVFLLQAPLQWIVALPVQFAAVSTSGSLGVLALFGIAVAAVGIVIETAADQQMSAFKADPKNKGKVMDRGLWGWSRHPNHFGDACTWWGVWLIAVDAGAAGVWSVAGPLLLTWLLLKFSGAPTIEPHLKKTRPEYADYIRRTSAFVPLPPKRG